MNRPTAIEASPATAVLMNILTPGLGHVLWREYSFGLFVFLIVLLGAVLFVATILVSLPPIVEIVMFTLVTIFYLFTFVDLIRTWKQVRATSMPTRRRLIILALVGCLFQFGFPLAPANFALLNAPRYTRMQTDNFAPMVRKGDLIKISRFAYWVNFLGLTGPILHDTPGRFDLVAFDTERGARMGIVFASRGESVEVIDGTLLINDMPAVSQSARDLVFAGDWPLTRSGDFSMLVASIRLGRIEALYEVDLTDIKGKVTTLF